MYALGSRLAPFILRAALGLAIGTALVSIPTRVLADTVYVTSDTVTLAALLPVLSGSELGELPIAPAPLPGETSVVRASEVRAKISQAGHDARGLDIPKSTRVGRRAQTLSQEDLKSRVTLLLTQAVAPCNVGTVSNFSALTIAEGAYELSTDTVPRRNSGRSSFMLTLKQGEKSQRLHGQVELVCPPPAVQPGSTVKLTITNGAVRVSAPAVAHQPGQPGDEIRVTSQLNRQSYLARVVDSGTVELVR